MSKKGARKTGGTGARKKALDSAMAARLKQDGVVRTTQRCAACGKMVGLKNYPNHIASNCTN